MLSNYQIADAFSLLSKLMDIHGENSFKAKSYAAAAFNIEKLPVQLADSDPARIASFKGVGESAARKIVEMLNSGQLSALTELVQKTPAGVLEMLSIKGLGPKKIATIWKEMEIESIGELLYACEENRLLRYKGFGEKTQQTVKENIEFYFQHKDIHLYADVEAYALAADQKLKQEFPAERFELTGEFRRQLEIIHQLEWVTTAGIPVLEQLLLTLQFSLVEHTEHTLSVKGPENITLKFYNATKEKFGTVLFTTSASEEFLKDWGEVPLAPEELQLFEAKGIAYLPPFLREEPGKQVPDNLVTTDSIRGLIHCHSNWSDGGNTIEEMARECIRRNWEYMVISDHSKSAGYANGLTEERIAAQHQLVDELNAKLAPFRIFKSIEADILSDGSLDYDDEILAGFDLVIASVHSNLKMTEEKAMMRLLNAIENPYTTILGHMTGRLLLSRPGYPVDHKQIIDACVANQVVLELNAHPRRLDLDWRWIGYAQQKGALLSIDPDAHELTGFDDTRFGVLAARKGGLTVKNNLSSFSRIQLEHYITDIRKEKGI